MRTIRLRTLLVGLLAYGALVAAAAVVRQSALFDDPEPPHGPYVALGDSYTAGPKIPNRVGTPAGCDRSDHDYPALVAQHLGMAATGGIGSQLLAQAVADGHEVTAVVRSPERLRDSPARVVTADLSAPDPASLLSAVAGADAVLSGLGARSEAEAGVASRGTRALVEAMQASGVRRIVVVSAASVGTVPSPRRPDPPRHNPGDGFFMRHLAAPLAKAAFRRHYADLALMEDVLLDSGLDWTVSRPPRLLDGRLTRKYRTAYEQNVRAGMFISRADVAHHMLDVLDRPETIHRVIGIAY